MEASLVARRTVEAILTLGVGARRQDGEPAAGEPSRQSLEEDTFDGNRYAYEIDVEGLQAIPNYAGELRQIIRDGIAVHRTDEFDTVCNMILHGDLDE